MKLVSGGGHFGVDFGVFWVCYMAVIHYRGVLRGWGGGSQALAPCMGVREEEEEMKMRGRRVRRGWPQAPHACGRLRLAPKAPARP